MAECKVCGEKIEDGKIYCDVCAPSEETVEEIKKESPETTDAPSVSIEKQNAEMVKDDNPNKVILDDDKKDASYLLGPDGEGSDKEE